jgi:hypothetical protein
MNFRDAETISFRIRFGFPETRAETPRFRDAETQADMLSIRSHIGITEMGRISGRFYAADTKRSVKAFPGRGNGSRYVPFSRSGHVSPNFTLQDRYPATQFAEFLV